MKTQCHICSLAQGNYSISARADLHWEEGHQPCSVGKTSQILKCSAELSDLEVSQSWLLELSTYENEIIFYFVFIFNHRRKLEKWQDNSHIYKNLDH